MLADIVTGIDIKVTSYIGKKSYSLTHSLTQEYFLCCHPSASEESNASRS